MKLLVVGGAGYVGSILRPALEAEHDCRHLDIKPVEGAGPDSIVGDVDDEATARKALEGVEGILWVAMGVPTGPQKIEGCQNVNAAFDVNVRAFYRLLNFAHKISVRRVVYASSLSVYEHCNARGKYPLDESFEPDAFDPYGMTKRLGEIIGQTWALQQEERTFVALRLMWPRSDQDWPGNEYKRGRTSSLTRSGHRVGLEGSGQAAAWHPTGPNDLRRLFLAALALERPGAFAIQASGDLEGLAFPFTQVKALLGWQPQGN